jgi:hypothetical protein
MDVGSRRISVSQVSREPDVARETGSGDPRPCLGHGGLRTGHGATAVPVRIRRRSCSPSGVSGPRVRAAVLPPVPQSQRHLRSLASTAAPPPVPAVPAASQVARVPGRSAVLPRPRPLRRATVSAVGPPCYRVRGRSAVRSAPSIARIRGVARLRFPDWRGSAGSAQRINGVSRLLPYSDLLALTSSSRRGEDVSDRGSWKRLRILLTGHVDAHAEPDIETVMVPYRACVVP